MTKVKKRFATAENRKVTLSISDDAYALSVSEFFVLCLKLYKKLTYVNNINISILSRYSKDEVIRWRYKG